MSENEKMSESEKDQLIDALKKGNGICRIKSIKRSSFNCYAKR